MYTFLLGNFTDLGSEGVKSPRLLKLMNGTCRTFPKSMLLLLKTFREAYCSPTALPASHWPPAEM